MTSDRIASEENKQELMCSPRAMIHHRTVSEARLVN
jgi:hypothetical protein